MENLNPKPSIGRIVHLRDEAEGCLAAVVTSTVSDDDDVNLFVMASDSSWHESDVTLGELPGTWHWPERA